MNSIVEPAFPQVSTDPDGDLWDPGMSLRDYFAAKALQGLLACPIGDNTQTTYAKLAYEYADAMLKARGA